MLKSAHACMTDHFRGRLEVFGLADLLQWMELNRRSGRLTVTSVGGPRPLEYLVVDLEDVRVTSCLLADAADPERPTENVALAYGKIHVAYTQQSPTGAPGAVSELSGARAAR